MVASASELAQGSDRPEAEILRVLDRALEVLADVGCPHLMIGGIGSAVWGRDRGTQDIDVFVRPESAPEVLAAFERAGFGTEVRFEHWLYKATLDGIEVDVIFRVSRDILLDDEMLSRSAVAGFRGRSVRVAAPEDLVVMKAVVAGEDTARYWYDAVAILAHAPIDWPYLVQRARQHGARRILSLLLFATSIDLVIPNDPVRQLLRALDLVEEPA
jgi:predicted nucleotidyltransferase